MMRLKSGVIPDFSVSFFMRILSVCAYRFTTENL